MNIMNNATKSIILTGRYLSQHFRSSMIGPQIRKKWAEEVLALLNFQISAENTSTLDGPAIYVANHISYIDIPLLMATIENCSFVSKREVAQWPLFGTASKKIGTVFVDRNSKNSRQEARKQIEIELMDNRQKIVVFPSGTTTLGEEKHWRKGVFEIAQKLEIPIQPVRINYSQLRTVAYIDQDVLLFHLYKLGKQQHIDAKVEFHKPLWINDVESSLNYCRSWCNGRAPTSTKLTPKTKENGKFHTVLTEA